MTWKVGDRPPITEDDWIKPLVMVREFAKAAGVLLTWEDEQRICELFMTTGVNLIADQVEGCDAKQPTPRLAN